MTQKEISIAFQTDKTVRDYIALAKLVNTYAFDVVSVYCDAPFHPSYGPLMVMAPHIKTARIGPAAVSPYRIHPIDIAASTALLSEVAAGGVYIGLARGAWLEEHGIAEPKKAIPGIREAVTIVRDLLSGKQVGLDGEVFSFAENVRAPYPLPETTIPVMIGTWGKKLAQVAGEIADEVKIGGSANPKMAQYLRKFIAKGEENSGRGGDRVGVVLGAVTVVDEDRKSARDKARMEVALYLPVVARLDPTVQVDPDLLARIRQRVQERDYKSAGALITDDMLDLFAFAGTPEDLIDQSAAILEAGVNRIEFGTPHGLSSAGGIKLLGEKVVPVLRKLL